MWYGSVAGLECGNFTERCGSSESVVVILEVLFPQMFHKNPGLKCQCFPLVGAGFLHFFVKEVSGLGCVHFYASDTCHMSIQVISFDGPPSLWRIYRTSKTYSVVSTSNWCPTRLTLLRPQHLIPTYITITYTIKTSNLSKLQTWILFEAILTENRPKDTFTCHEFRFVGWDYSTPGWNEMYAIMVRVTCIHNSIVPSPWSLIVRYVISLYNII